MDNEFHTNMKFPCDFTTIMKKYDGQWYISQIRETRFDTSKYFQITA